MVCGAAPVVVVFVPTAQGGSGQTQRSESIPCEQEKATGILTVVLRIRMRRRSGTGTGMIIQAGEKVPGRPELRGRSTNYFTLWGPPIRKQGAGAAESLPRNRKRLYGPQFSSTFLTAQRASCLKELVKEKDITDEIESWRDAQQGETIET